MAHIETLIQFHKKESMRLGFQRDMEIFWITFRIMDYFYKQTMDGTLKNSLIYYCKLLEGSSILEKYGGSVAKMIDDIKLYEQSLIDTTLSALKARRMEFNLNPGNVITILQMCNMFSWVGAGSSRKSRNRKRRCRRCNRKSKTI
jgi:hypothetical protein